MTTNKLNALAMILGLASIISLSSCLGDNDDEYENETRPLTQSEKQIAVSNAAGEYSGFMYFVNEKIELDSLVSSATVTAPDSVVTVSIPSSTLIPSLKRQYLSEDHAELLKKAPNLSLKGILHPNYNKYWNAADYTFVYTYVNNTATVTFTVDEVDHILECKFADIIYSGGMYYQRIAEYYNNKFFCNVLFETVKLDGYSFTINTSMTFEGKRN